MDGFWQDVNTRGIFPLMRTIDDGRRGGLARGSAFERAPLLEICGELQLVPDSSAALLKDDLDSIGKMLTTLIKGTEKRVSD